MPITDPLTKAMWNWATYHRRTGGEAKTRQDWLSTWGDLGGAMYDWGRVMWDQGLGDSVTEEAFQTQIAGLGQTSPIGGAVGKFYAPPPPAAEEELAAERQFGPAADALWDNIQKGIAAYGGVSRQALVNSWGDLGGATWDWMQSNGVWDARGAAIPGNMPRPDQFRQVVSYLAYTKPPGGSQGFVYAGAPNVQQQQQQWQNAFEQKTFEANEAYRQAQLALQQGNQALAQQHFALAEKAQSDANAIAQAQLAQQGQQFNVGATGFTQGGGLEQMAQSMYAFVAGRLGLTNKLNRNDMVGAWGELGGRAFDWLVQKSVITDQGIKSMSYLPNSGLVEWAMSTSQVVPPGGTMGQAYGPQKSLDRTRIEADIAATNERIRIAEQQGNSQLALDERKRVDALQIQLGQLGQQEAGITGYYGGQPTFAREQYATELQANPRDWAKAWMYQRGQNPEAALTVPPWLQNVAQNKPSALWQGSAGGLGTFPIKAPDPNQVSAKTFQTMAPSEQEGLMGLASSSEWYIPDYIKQMQNTWQRQNIRPADVWAGGY